MADEGFKRKLTAILSADVIGYSRLMRDDEEATVRDIAAHRILITEIIQQNNGRVVDSPGDNILAEFASVVDAVNGAIKIQREIKESNTGIHQDRRMEFRIGINLGDVIEEDERIYGDGVNIAARVEGLAAGGGIAISGAVYEQVKEKLSLGYHYLGEQDVKNISEPIQVYRLLTEPHDAGKLIYDEKPESNKLLWVAAAVVVLTILSVCTITIRHYYFRPSFEPASMDKMALPLPEKPSIAVLPFDNMSGDPEQDYIADGFTEEIITALSKVQNIFVIARNSTFTYKDKPVKVQQVAEELGVRYVVDGSVRKAGDKVRISAQLVDAITGKQLWAERYDRELEDIFAVQDEITKRIITELQVKLTEGEQARILAKGTDNLEAYLKFLQARELLTNFKPENIAVIRQLSEEAIAIDPEWPNAYWTLGATYLMDVFYGLTKTPDESIEKAYELVQKTIALDEKLGVTQHGLSVIYTLKKRHEKAIEHGRLAVELNPNSSDFKQNLARILMNAGRPQESIPLYKKALRLNPYSPSGHYSNYGYALWMMGKYEEALAAGEEARRRGPDVMFSHILTTATYIELGRDQNARESASEVLKIKPDLTLEWLAKMLPWKNKDDADRLIGDLRKAGLPEHPPLKLPDKPSIAVLPFDNLSKDPEQEYFADGMTDDLTTDLSKISGLFVIARNSTFQYKGKAVDVKAVSRELGIRYVLEGSVRKAGDKVRINAQLIDATTGGHLWAERYDGQMDDIFSLQDNITQKIVAALAVKLTTGEEENIASKGTENIEAYDAFLKGWEHLHRITPNDFEKALSFLRKAIELDPSYSRAHAALAFLYFLSSNATFPAEWRLKMDLNFESARLKARKHLEIALRNPTSVAYSLAGWMARSRRRFDEALTYAERAISLDPNEPDAHRTMARVLLSKGKPKEALEFINKVMQLDPHNMAQPLYLSAKAHYYMGNLEKAATLIERAIMLNPGVSEFYDDQAQIYALLGREEEARKAYKRYIRTWDSTPKLDGIMSFVLVENRKLQNQIAEAYLKIGVPGRASEYYKIYKENRLNGDEIRHLVSGHELSILFYGYPCKIDHLEDGKSRSDGWSCKYIGTSDWWIEDDMLCGRGIEDLKDCKDIYRNPERRAEINDDYFQVTDYGIMPFSVVE